MAIYDNLNITIFLGVTVHMVSICVLILRVWKTSILAGEFASNQCATSLEDCQVPLWTLHFAYVSLEGQHHFLVTQL